MEHILAAVLDLFGDVTLQEKADAVAKSIFQYAEVSEDEGRQIFTNGMITVNILPALLIAAGIAGLIKLGAFGFLFGNQGGDSGGDTSYGVSSGYGAPSSGYGAPSSGYGAPESAGYDAPSQGYGSIRRRREVLSPDQKEVFATQMASLESRSGASNTGKGYDGPQALKMDHIQYQEIPTPLQLS